ncbi:hypothetical protein D3C78_1576080 [compost metagenome]
MHRIPLGQRQGVGRTDLVADDEDAGRARAALPLVSRAGHEVHAERAVVIVHHARQVGAVDDADEFMGLDHLHDLGDGQHGAGHVGR